tara:strand:- start:15050 stop:15547 length:498 start_codon:yes stop_codon:yes gene_type:complete
MDSGGFFIESEVKDSCIPNAGKGRFFSRDYEKGKVVRIQEIETDLLIFKNIQEIRLADEDLILNFGHSRCQNSDINTDYVYVNKQPLYTNHSSNNNISFQIQGGKKLTYLTRDVKAGEEMLQNYEEYAINMWFEKYLHTQGKKSLREFGIEFNKDNMNNYQEIEL